MKTTALAADRRPGPLTRIIAVILVLVVVLSTGALIIGNWYHSTILSVDWYRPAIKSQSLQSVLRETIVNEITREIDQSSIFASILTQAVERVMTNDRIDSFLDKYLVRFVDYLYDRSDSPFQTDAAAMFSNAFLSYAHEASQQLGIQLPAFFEHLIVEMAARIGEIAEKNLEIFTRDRFVHLAALQKYHQILLWISQSVVQIIIALFSGLFLLLLLFFHQIYRFFVHAVLGIWSAGAVIGLPLLAFRVSDQNAFLVDTPAVIRPVIESLVTLAADRLKMISLTVLAGATAALAVLFIVHAAASRYAGRR